MSKAALLSIKPKYCELIASGKKTIEVRKTKPKLDTPFKCYIYCTNTRTIGDIILCKSDKNAKLFGYNTVKGINKGFAEKEDVQLKGKVIGEFVCDNIIKFAADKKADNIKLSNMELLSCLSSLELENYAGDKYYLYGFHIFDLVIYDKPKKITKFYKPCGEHDCFLCDYWVDEVQVCTQPPITRPPQSWYYVEELI